MRRLASLLSLDTIKSLGPARILSEFMSPPPVVTHRDEILRHRQMQAAPSQHGVLSLHQRNCQLFDLATSARTSLQQASDACDQAIINHSTVGFQPNFLTGLSTDTSTSEAQLLLQTAAYQTIAYKNALHVSNQSTTLIKKEWQLKGVNMDVDPLFTPVLEDVPSVFFGEEQTPQVDKLRNAQSHCHVLINKLNKHQTVLQHRLDDTSFRLKVTP